jgi:hypothetical protein
MHGIVFSYSTSLIMDQTDLEALLDSMELFNVLFGCWKKGEVGKFAVLNASHKRSCMQTKHPGPLHQFSSTKE